MIWDAASFRVINEARRLAALDEEGKPKLPGLLHGLLNRTFFAAQAASIRRLTDPKGKNPKKAVFSLTALIDDLRANADLLTREAMLDAEGLPCNYSEIQEKKAEFVAAQSSAGRRVIDIPPELNWQRYEERYKQLDRLCNVSAESRQRTDTISPEVFSKLSNKLNSACGSVQQYVNKYIAHAATRKSRESADPIPALTLHRLWTAHSAICQVANFVGVYILGDNSIGSLANPIYDHLAHFDAPLVKKDQIYKLKDVWDKFDRETQECANWGLAEFDTECLNPP